MAIMQPLHDCDGGSIPSVPTTNHWYVATPQYTSYYYLDEAISVPEQGADVVYVTARNKKEAKVEGVRALRKMDSDWLDDVSSNPFTGLEAGPCQCPHGFCYCEIKDCVQPNPEWVNEDLCPDCVEEDNQNCVHEMYTGLVSYGREPATLVEHCNMCMQTREQIDARINQRFATSSSI
jgi:hypothetical protein